MNGEAPRRRRGHRQPGRADSAPLPLAAGRNNPIYRRRRRPWVWRGGASEGMRHISSGGGFPQSVPVASARLRAASDKPRAPVLYMGTRQETGRRSGFGEKCQICHFELLTPRKVAHITRPPLTTRRQKAPTKSKAASEITKKLAISGFQNSDLPKDENRVLTDGNVSNTTRHVDDAERHSLPLFSDPERADLLPGDRKKALFCGIRRLTLPTTPPSKEANGVCSLKL